MGAFRKIYVVVDQLAATEVEHGSGAMENLLDFKIQP